jgi:hypothetical protein
LEVAGVFSALNLARHWQNDNEFGFDFLH